MMQNQESAGGGETKSSPWRLIDVKSLCVWRNKHMKIMVRHEGEYKCFCERLKYCIFMETWQLSRLSNYFHTERSWAGGGSSSDVFVLALCWCRLQVSHLIHDWLLCPKGTSCCPWLNTELYLTDSHSSRHVNAHTHAHKPQNLVNAILGFSLRAILDSGPHNHILRHAQTHECKWFQLSHT